MLRWRWRMAVWVMLAANFGITGAAGADLKPAAAYTVNVAAPGAPALELYAEEMGRGSPVVLLHGLGGSTYSWRFIAPELARGHRVIAVDLKGFGRSGKAFDTGYSAADQAKLIATFLVRRGLRHVTLAGHSFGGQVAMMTALELARRDPTRIERLILIDAPALPQPISPAVQLMRQPVLPYALLTAVPSDILTRIALAGSPGAEGQRFERDYTDEDARAYAAPFHDAAARHAYIQTARQIVPDGLPEIVARYHGISQPTLLVWCRGDQVVPLETGRALKRILPRARLETIEGCNHSPPDEAPEALARAIQRFLAD